jgi:AraC-like DNA-binding protein
MIAPSLEALRFLQKGSFLVRSFKEEAFTSGYHYHPEYELTLITKGRGKRYVGNNMDQFEEGDFVLVGSNLPHCWKTDPVVKGEINAGSLVIQFAEHFLGNDFFSASEMLEIKELLKRSSRGIKFMTCTAAHIKEKMTDIMTEKVNFKKLLILLNILYELSLLPDYKFLNSENALMKYSTLDLQKINLVYRYIIDHFEDKISLDKAAEVANMTPNAFCKYFKKTTGKTFMEVVIAYRLKYAATQLSLTNKPVSNVCYDSGFNDIAYFSRLFKKNMNLTPSMYRKNFIKNL